MNRDRRAPADWQAGVTRVTYPDLGVGTYIGPSLRAHDAWARSRRGWLGVLILFDGTNVPIDVDPADLEVRP